MVANNKRLPLFHRPWIRASGLYDKLTRPTVLHMDAYVLEVDALKYTVIDWNEAGHRPQALDVWLIEPDGLTPLWINVGEAEARWRIECIRGRRLSYGDHRDVIPWGPLHKRIVAYADDMEGKQYPKVTLQAHYIACPDIDCETFTNHWKPRAARKPKPMLPDWL